MSEAAGWKEYLLSIGCFLVLFLMYARFSNLKNKALALVMKIVGFSLAAAFLYGTRLKMDLI